MQWRIGRREWLAAVLAGAGCASARGAQVADLYEQLKSGLKATQPRELAFIQTVVTLVEQDRLPLSLVKGTFQWARERAGRKKYPFPYFEAAMRIRAERIGVTL